MKDPEYWNSSLDQLQGPWPMPEDPTHVIGAVHRARAVPLRDLSSEQLRILLSQEVEPQLVLPVALPRLAQNPLLEGDYYSGDVLMAALQLSDGFLRDHPELWHEVLTICSTVPELDNPTIQQRRDRLIQELRELT